MNDKEICRGACLVLLAWAKLNRLDQCKKTSKICTNGRMRAIVFFPRLSKRFGLPFRFDNLLFA